MSARSTEVLDVFKGHEHVGALSRTRSGARFQYQAAYVEHHTGDIARAIAFTLPVRREPYEIHGTNLHPFFAGLLPEGLRMRALVRATKTSEDDLFTLLVASGCDTVGDVAVSSAGTPLKERAPLADTTQLGQSSFRELLQESLRYEDAASVPDATIAGVQPKVSAAMISFPVRARDLRRAYILKLTPTDLPRLVENEAFFMQLAKSAGIEVARTRLVRDREQQTALLVERFDRVPGPDGQLQRLHQEDACQLLDRYPADKYRVSLRDIAEGLEICAAPIPSRLGLLRLQAFSYLIANGDLHAKNISVYCPGHDILLTPAYDLLSTLPYGDQTLALGIEGRDAKLKRQHFLSFAERIGLRQHAVAQMLTTLCDRVEPAIARLAEIGFTDKQTEHLARSMRARCSDLR
jgi:serine/threonine-protein kinase HipA